MDLDFIVSGSFIPYGIDSLEQCAPTGNASVAHDTCAVNETCYRLYEDMVLFLFPCFLFKIQNKFSYDISCIQVLTCSTRSTSFVCSYCAFQ